MDGIYEVVQIDIENPDGYMGKVRNTSNNEEKAYACVSGDAISGGTASGYGVEQITNIGHFGGSRERFPPLVDRVPTAFFG